MRFRTAVIGPAAQASLAGCGGDTASGPNGGNGAGGYGGGGGGGGGGGPIGSVTVGDNGTIAFLSAHNGSSNPAVDTVAIGGTVTWTWTSTQGMAHSVQSLGSPTFASSAIMSGDGQTYSVTFTTPGTYQYDCAVHGTPMIARVVVRESPLMPPSSVGGI